MESMCKLIIIKIFLFSNLVFLPNFCFADVLNNLSISFLGKQIGSIELIEVAQAGTRTIQINGEIFSSPFSVFNGQFEYKTVITEENNKPSGISYESNVAFAFKERKINYFVKNSQLIAVDVFPKKEQTKFTNPKQIVFEFIDPAYSVAKLLDSPCKNSFTIYDGRRIIDLISIKSADILQCRYLYKIRKGPGHLAPFNFKKVEISIFFDQEGNLTSRPIIIKTGPFKLILNKVH